MTNSTIPPYPFKVGDRIQSVGSGYEKATVTGFTEKGFTYHLDYRAGIPRMGLSWQDGECFVDGFGSWEKIPPSEDPVYATHVSIDVSTQDKAQFITSRCSNMTFSTVKSNTIMLMAASPSTSLIKIFSTDNKELVNVQRDGTVVVSEYGADVKAAKRFWEALQYCGISMVSRIRELEKRLAKYETVEAYLP